MALESNCLLRSEIPSGMCANLRTVAASSNGDHARNLLLLLARATYIMMLFFTHIPFVENHTINATPLERLKQLPLLFTNHTDRTFFVWRLNSAHLHILVTVPFCWRVSLCNTQARTVNLIHAMICHDEGVTQARGCLRHETDKGVERWHCTIYCLEFCAGFNDAKRQHLSTINTNKIGRASCRERV